MQSETSLKTNLSRNLIFLRESHDITQADLVEKLNVQYGLNLIRSSWASYESAAASPKLWVLSAVAKYFGTSIDQLVEANLSAEAGTFNHNNMVISNNVNLLAQGYADSLVRWQFYRELVGSIFEKLKQADHYAGLLEEFQSMHLDLIVKRSSFLQEEAQKALDQKEFAIFYGIHEKQSINYLAHVLKMTEDAVILKFNSAREKIAALIEKTSK